MADRTGRTNPARPGSAMPIGGTTYTGTIGRLVGQITGADGTTRTYGTTTPTTGADTPAKAQLKMYLDQWGLGELVEWAWGQLTAGSSAEQVMLSLRDQQAYKVRFAGNTVRAQKGLPPLSEAQYLAYEGQARQMMRAAGLPADLFDQPDDFAMYVGNDVSVSELAERVQMAATYAANDPTVSAAERAEMVRLYGEGGLAAYYLDPNKALPVLQRQTNAAAAAAAAQRAGFGALDRGQAERVTDLSSSIEQTAQAFGQLARQKELMRSLPGEMETPDITADEQINAALGNDAVASEKISRRGKKRVADFNATAGDYQVGLGRSTTNAL